MVNWSAMGICSGAQWRAIRGFSSSSGLLQDDDDNDDEKFVKNIKKIDFNEIK